MSDDWRSELGERLVWVRVGDYQEEWFLTPAMSSGLACVCCSGSVITGRLDNWGDEPVPPGIAPVIAVALLGDTDDALYAHVRCWESLRRIGPLLFNSTRAPRSGRVLPPPGPPPLPLRRRRRRRHKPKPDRRRSSD